MERPKICLCLTETTIAKDLEILNSYRNWIDMVELRVDCLENDERLHIRKFPQLAGLPCILTIRRKTDGGFYVEGEASRTMLFARALAFASQDIRKNFAYVDFEEDFHIPSLQDAALAFGTTIIRSAHDMNKPITDIPARLAQMRTTGYEIPKIACMPQRLEDVTKIFRQTANLTDTRQIVIAMGPYGLPTRILADKMNSYLTFVSAETSFAKKKLGHIDPITMNNVYNFRFLHKDTAIYGITGYPLEATDSPVIHNEGYRKHGMNAVYIPIRSDSIGETLRFADELDIKGLSVTIPHKESVIDHLSQISNVVYEVGACNTIRKEKDGWHGFNTDSYGIKEAIKDFLGVENLKNKKVAIIGAGGAARAVAHAVKQLKGKACIFNRTLSKAKLIAAPYKFKWASLGPESLHILQHYSYLIIQTTSKGMGASLPPTKENDPLYFYDFTGEEALYDIVYHPDITPVMYRAMQAGCLVSNGYSMLQYQGYDQFRLFTGETY